MNFHILTLFPDMVMQGLSTSIIGRAKDRGLLSIEAVNIRDYTLERHKKVDDYPYGGGAGMLMQAQPVYDACMAVKGDKPTRVIYMTPQGQTFTQEKAQELSKEEELIFLCGHYEGVDHRVVEELVDMELSIGDYILTNGAIASVVVIDAVARLIPGVLGDERSSVEESFSNGLLEAPAYTKPNVFRGLAVPEILLGGNHPAIEKWKHGKSLERTRLNRPDLWRKWLESHPGDATE